MNAQEWSRWLRIARALTSAYDTLTVATDDRAAYLKALRDQDGVTEREAMASLLRLHERHQNYRSAAADLMRFVNAHEWEGWGNVSCVDSFILCFTASGDYAMPSSELVDLMETVRPGAL